MPGVVFLIVVPTANFEREFIYGAHCYDLSATKNQHPISGCVVGNSGLNNQMNIQLPETNKGILRLEVELRDKNAPKNRRGVGFGNPYNTGRQKVISVTDKRSLLQLPPDNLDGNAVVPLEKVLEELLAKLEIEHVTWMTSKQGYFHQVVFPLQAGDPCETTLHCLTELGIGTKLNSSVSVLPCSVSYDAITSNVEDIDDPLDGEDLTKWNSFVESIKSKLTVKQVVDGVRAGGSLSFDYILLIVTADSLAALGLVENNAPNITAAMLVSPLMGPVMSITFGAIISDRELLRVGFISLAVGMFLSCLFGFIFGLILGTTEMPWGSGDWPTEEMRGRGNVRSLWMGVLWALTSGTGVAVALLQGSAGPLIGVAISASLLPPVVNCGLFWALACIWLIYPGTRIPHLKGEGHNETTAYPFLYTDYLPTEFLINGIVSCLLTVVNVICIFITAIIVLKIKEVSAPYTASPDLKRFWETDLRTVRKTNRSTIRRHGAGRSGAVDEVTGSDGIDATLREKLLRIYPELDEKRNDELDNVLEQAFKEAQDDVTFKKVKRMSYSSNAARGEFSQRLAKLTGMHKPHESVTFASNRMNSIRASKTKLDLKALDKLVTNLLEQLPSNNLENNGNNSSNAMASSKSGMRKSSLKLNRWRSSSRSGRNRRSFKYNNDEKGVTNYVALLENDSNTDLVQDGPTANITETTRDDIGGQHMPTIMESCVGGSSSNNSLPPKPNNSNTKEYSNNNLNRETIPSSIPSAGFTALNLNEENLN